MPRTSFQTQHKNPGEVDRFPKYKLDTGEKSRIWLPEEPWMEWYHRIEAPMIEDGEVALEVKDTKRGPVEVWKMDWIGSVFCIGETGTPEDPGPLMLNGIDPDNCPACESAARQTGVAPPQQRFAANVVKYKVSGRGTKPYDLSSPVSAEILIWAYTSRQHGMLYELSAEHGDLRRHDIKIELEDSPGAAQYQKIKQIGVIVEPAYKSPKVKEYVTELWKNNPENRATDEQLRDACLGRDVARPVLLEMVRRAERQYRDAERGGSAGGDGAAADSAFNGGLAAGIDSLLDEGSRPPAGEGDPWAEEEKAAHPGGTEEFMSPEQRVAALKRETQREVSQILSPDPLADDPFAGETPTVTGATTTATAAPAAESRSRTEPRSAQSAASSESYDRQDEADWEGRQKATQQTLNEEAAKSREQAVERAADDMFGEAEPAPAKTRQRKPKDEPASNRVDTPKTRADLPPTAPEPASVPAGAGDVIDFDDLFKD